MELRRPKALVIGENPQGSSHLAKRLQERGCECEFAVSYQEARSLLGAQNFDLAVSPMRLRDVSLFPLIFLLDRSNITLFYFHAVEDGCWWLPALRHGQKCFGSCALRPASLSPRSTTRLRKSVFVSLRRNKFGYLLLLRYLVPALHRHRYGENCHMLRQSAPRFWNL